MIKKIKPRPQVHCAQNHACLDKKHHTIIFHWKYYGIALLRCIMYFKAYTVSALKTRKLQKMILKQFRPTLG